MNNINPIYLLELSMEASAALKNAESFRRACRDIMTFFGYIGKNPSRSYVEKLARETEFGSLSPRVIGAFLRRGKPLTGNQMNYLEKLKTGVLQLT